MGPGDEWSPMISGFMFLPVLLGVMSLTNLCDKNQGQSMHA